MIINQPLIKKEKYGYLYLTMDNKSSGISGKLARVTHPDVNFSMIMSAVASRKKESKKVAIVDIDKIIFI